MISYNDINDYRDVEHVHNKHKNTLIPPASIRSTSTASNQSNSEKIPSRQSSYSLSRSISTESRSYSIESNHSPFLNQFRKVFQQSDNKINNKNFKIKNNNHLNNLIFQDDDSQNSHIICNDEEEYIVRNLDTGETFSPRASVDDIPPTISPDILYGYK